MAAEQHGMMDEYKEKLRASCELCHLDLDDWSVEDVNELILHVMKHGLSKSDSNAFGSAAGLFQELVCYGSQPEDIQIRFSKSRKAGEQQAIVEQMENAINHPVFRIRWNSLSMLARSGSVESIEKMIEFFGRAIKNDPAILPRLVSEISWLSGFESAGNRYDGVYEGLLERLVQSGSYMNRWAAVEIIQESSEPDKQKKLLAQLKADKHPMVRLQATNPRDASAKRADFYSIFYDNTSVAGYSVADIDRRVSEWVAANAA